MVNFVSQLPETLEANGIYFVQKSDSKGELYVADNGGEAVGISTEALTIAYVMQKVNAADGIAGLGANGKLALSVMPSEFKTSSEISSEISNQVSALVNSAPAVLDTIGEISAALGNDENFATTVSTQLAGKQAVLSNATQVAKIGDGTFDGKPIVLIETAEW